MNTSNKNKNIPKINNSFNKNNPNSNNQGNKNNSNSKNQGNKNNLNINNQGNKNSNNQNNSNSKNQGNKNNLNINNQKNKNSNNQGNKNNSNINNQRNKNSNNPGNKKIPFKKYKKRYSPYQQAAFSSKKTANYLKNRVKNLTNIFKRNIKTQKEKKVNYLKKLPKNVQKKHQNFLIKRNKINKIGFIYNNLLFKRLQHKWIYSKYKRFYSRKLFKKRKLKCLWIHKILKKNSRNIFLKKIKKKKIFFKNKKLSFSFNAPLDSYKIYRKTFKLCKYLNTFVRHVVKNQKIYDIESPQTIFLKPKTKTKIKKNKINSVVKNNFINNKKFQSVIAKKKKNLKYLIINKRNILKYKKKYKKSKNNKQKKKLLLQIKDEKKKIKNKKIFKVRKKIYTFYKKYYKCSKPDYAIIPTVKSFFYWTKQTAWVFKRNFRFKKGRPKIYFTKKYKFKNKKLNNLYLKAINLKKKLNKNNFLNTNTFYDNAIAKNYLKKAILYFNKRTFFFKNLKFINFIYFWKSSYNKILNNRYNIGLKKRIKNKTFSFSANKHKGIKKNFKKYKQIIAVALRKKHNKKLILKNRKRDFVKNSWNNFFLINLIKYDFIYISSIYKNIVCSSIFSTILGDKSFVSILNIILVNMHLKQFIRLLQELKFLKKYKLNIVTIEPTFLEWINEYIKEHMRGVICYKIAVLEYLPFFEWIYKMRFRAISFIMFFGNTWNKKKANLNLYRLINLGVFLFSSISLTFKTNMYRVLNEASDLKKLIFVLILVTKILTKKSLHVSK